MGLFNFGSGEPARGQGPGSHLRRNGHQSERTRLRDQPSVPTRGRNDPEPPDRSAPQEGDSSRARRAGVSPDDSTGREYERREADSRPGRQPGPGPRPRPHPKLPGSRAIRAAKEHLAELTGQMPEAVSGLTATPEGGWKVTLDVVELERIPQTTDVMASYEMELDGQGELVGYRRIRRYYRNQVDEI